MTDPPGPGGGVCPARVEVQRPTALASSALFIFERPLMPLRLASAYSCSFVRPPAPLWDRRPPRRPDEMSSVDVRLFSLDSPLRARSLFTVRAAISSAVSSLRPRFSSPLLMCSYWRSRLSLHWFRGIAVSFQRPPHAVPESPWDMRCASPARRPGRRSGESPVEGLLGLLAGVLDLLAGLAQLGLAPLQVALGLQVGVVGRVAGHLLDLALGLVGGILRLVGAAHRYLPVLFPACPPVRGHSSTGLTTAAGSQQRGDLLQIRDELFVRRRPVVGPQHR